MTTSNPGQLELIDTQAQELLARAHSRAQRREAATPRVDYKAFNQLVRRQRAALTRAINSGDSEQVVLACAKAVREWNQPNLMWPDDWSWWQRALDDVLPFHQPVTLRDLAD